VRRAESRAQAMNAPNPLLQAWDTPFGVPPFDRISSSDYLPALRSGMDEQNVEIAAIVNNPVAATFSNTIEALEISGAALARVSNVFYAVNSAHADKTVRETAGAIAPEMAAHKDGILLNEALFERIRDVYGQRENLDLGAEQRRLLEETHKRFVRAGAGLQGSAQSRLREINARLAELSQKFDENLLDETNDFELLVTDRVDLGDLPENLVEMAAAEAVRRGHDPGSWVFTLHRASINPFLQYSPNRVLRKTIFEAYALRGDNDNAADNNAIIAQTVALRAERAALLGYDSHAHYVLSDEMAESPDRVFELLDQVWQPARRVAERERADLQAMMAADGIDEAIRGWDWRYYSEKVADGIDEAIRGWDWRYYSEKVRKAKFDIDDDALRPYFEVNAVRDGVFALAIWLFGLQFKERDDFTKWHPDQQVFEVT
jgi:peptidyl-dipeptidase Dcp